MRRHHAQYALLLLAATTLRAVYEYEGMVRSSSLAASLQSPRRLGCSVDDASFDAEAEKVMPIRYDPGGSHRPFSPRSALCGGLGVCPGPKKCYEKVNDDRATYKEGVRAAYKCAEGPPGSKWNLAGDLPPTTIRRRANAKELRRAYDRAREELRTLEREARPKDIK